MNKTLMEKVKCMVSNTQLRILFLQKPRTLHYLINHSSSVAIQKKTLQEVWFGSSATYSDLKIFGCLVYAHVDNGKLELRSVKCIFLGYKSGVKGYKLW